MTPLRFRLAACSLALALALPALAQTAPIRSIPVSPEFSADQILNGSLPRPASPPPLPVTFDATGFRQDRVFHVPAVGVHPRVLFAPQDLPGIQQRLADTASGRQMLAFARKQIAEGIDKPGTWENLVYQALLAGDTTAFAALYKTEDKAPVSGNAPIRSDMPPATKWHHRDSFAMALEIKAFLCLLDHNQAEGAKLGTAIAAYAAYFRPRIEKAAAGPYGESWWRSMRTALDGYPCLPLAYDLDFNYMTRAQRDSTRAVLSLLTKGRTALGMELPAHWRNWNFLGLAMYEGMFSLAIEGEEGYDPRVFARTEEVARDYIAYSINPSGMAHESVGYHSGGMTHTSFFMIAMANRGDKSFTQSHYRAMLDQWYLQTMQPYGGEWFSDGDLGNFPPAIEQLMIAKYFYPDDPKLDYVYQHTLEARTNNFAKDLFLLEAMIVASDPRRDAEGKLVDYHAGADFHLPTSYTDDARGVTITRSDWSRDALYLNFECQPDTTYATHDHADRGRFVLSALGRNWAWQDSRPHETANTNSVLIDDQGQGFYPPPAKWLGVSDTPQATFAGCDATYPYTWKWRKQAGMWEDDDPRFQTDFYRALRGNSPKLDKSTTEYDPSPSVVAYYKDYLAGNPRMWDEDSWVVRQPNNPVQYAFREAGIVRSDHPYAVIVDDIRKDATAHDYKWLMQLEDDLLIEKQTVHDGIRDIILAEKKGDRRLLVRVFDSPDASAPAIAEHYNADIKVQGLPQSATMMYRLTIPTKATVFASKIILYPFHTGEPLPNSTWNARTGKATVLLPSATDELTFNTSQEGRTRVMIARNGKPIATTK